MGNSSANCQYAMKSWLCPWGRRWLQNSILPALIPTFLTVTAQQLQLPAKRPSSKSLKRWQRRLQLPLSRTSTIITSRLPAGSPLTRRCERGKGAFGLLFESYTLLWIHKRNIVLHFVLFRNALMFNNELMADVHFVVGPPGASQKVPAHKVSASSRVKTHLKCLFHQALLNRSCVAFVLPVCAGSGEFCFWCHVLRRSSRRIWDSYSWRGACCFFNSFEVSSALNFNEYVSMMWNPIS